MIVKKFVIYCQFFLDLNSIQHISPQFRSWYDSFVIFWIFLKRKRTTLNSKYSKEYYSQVEIYSGQTFYENRLGIIKANVEVTILYFFTKDDCITSHLSTILLCMNSILKLKFFSLNNTYFLNVYNYLNSHEFTTIIMYYFPVFFNKFTPLRIFWICYS